MTAIQKAAAAAHQSQSSALPQLTAASTYWTRENTCAGWYLTWRISRDATGMVTYQWAPGGFYLLQE